MRVATLLATAAPLVQAAELCDISLTPSQLMMATFESGAQTTKFTNLRVECKSLYRRSATEVMKVDVPLTYRRCQDQEGEYDKEKNTCVKFSCPQPCSVWDPSCADRRGDNLFGDSKHWPEYDAKVKEVTMTKEDFKAMGDMMHDHHNVGNFWWNEDDSKYKKIYTAFDGCHQAWDHMTQTPKKDTCRCGVVNFYKAKDPAVRHEWDHRPHGKEKTDDYFLRQWSEIQFPARRYTGPDCATDAEKEAAWRLIFPDFNKTWTMPGFRDRWARDPQHRHPEHLPGNNDHRPSCDHAPHPALKKACQDLFAIEHVDILFGHSIEQLLRDDMFPQHQGPDGPRDVREICLHEAHTFYERYMVFTGQWVPTTYMEDHVEWSHDENAKTSSGFVDWCMSVVNKVKTGFETAKTEIEAEMAAGGNPENMIKDGEMPAMESMEGEMKGEMPAIEGEMPAMEGEMKEMPAMEGEMKGEMPAMEGEKMLAMEGEIPLKRRTEAHHLQGNKHMEIEGFLHQLHELFRNSYVMVDEATGNKTFPYRYNPNEQHWSEVQMPLWKNNDDLQWGHLFPKFYLPKKFGKDCFSYTEYSDTIKDYNRRSAENFPNVIKPVWNCAAPITIPESAIMLAPPTTDPAHAAVRLGKRDGVETKLNILESTKISSAKVNFFVMHEQETGGSVRKLGPSTEELKSACKVKLNMFFDTNGTRSINDNGWIALADLPERPPNCDAEGVAAANVEFDNTLTSLVAAQDVQCNNTDTNGHRSLLAGEQSSLDFDASATFPAHHMDTVERKGIMTREFGKLKERLHKKYSSKLDSIEKKYGSKVQNTRSLTESAKVDYVCEELFLEHVEDELDGSHPLNVVHFNMAYGGNPEALENHKEEFIVHCLEHMASDSRRLTKLDARQKKAIAVSLRYLTRSLSAAKKAGLAKKAPKKLAPSTVMHSNSRLPFSKGSRDLAEYRAASEKIEKARSNKVLKMQKGTQRRLAASKMTAKRLHQRTVNSKKVKNLRLFDQRKSKRALAARFFKKNKVQDPMAKFTSSLQKMNIAHLKKELARIQSHETVERLTNDKQSAVRARKLQAEAKQVQNRIRKLQKKIVANSKLVQKRDYSQWGDLKPKGKKAKKAPELTADAFRRLFKNGFTAKRGLTKAALQRSIKRILQNMPDMPAGEDMPADMPAGDMKDIPQGGTAAAPTPEQIAEVVKVTGLSMTELSSMSMEDIEALYLEKLAEQGGTVPPGMTSAGSEGEPNRSEGGPEDSEGGDREGGSSSGGNERPAAPSGPPADAATPLKMKQFKEGCKGVGVELGGNFGAMAEKACYDTVEMAVMSAKDVPLIAKTMSAARKYLFETYATLGYDPAMADLCEGFEGHSAEAIEVCKGWFQGFVGSVSGDGPAGNDILTWMAFVINELKQTVSKETGFKEEKVDLEKAKTFWRNIGQCHTTLAGMLKEDPAVMKAVEASGVPDGVDQCLEEIMGDFGATITDDLGLKASVYTANTPVTTGCIAFLRAFNNIEDPTVAPDFCALRTRVVAIAKTMLEGPETTTPAAGMLATQEIGDEGPKGMRQCCTYILRWEISFSMAKHKFSTCDASNFSLSKCPKGGVDTANDYCWASDRVMEFAGGFYGIDLAPFEICESQAPKLASDGINAAWDLMGDCVCKSGRCNEMSSMFSALFTSSLECSANANRVTDICAGRCPICGDLDGTDSEYEQSLPAVITSVAGNSQKCRYRTGAWFLGPGLQELKFQMEMQALDAEMMASATAVEAAAGSAAGTNGAARALQGRGPGGGSQLPPGVTINMLREALPDLFTDVHGTCSDKDLCDVFAEFPAALDAMSKMDAKFQTCNCESFCGPFAHAVFTKQNITKLVCPNAEMNWALAMSATEKMCSKCKESFDLPRLPSPDEAFKVEEEKEVMGNPNQSNEPLICRQAHTTFYNAYQACPKNLPNVFKDQYGLPFTTPKDNCTAAQETAYCSVIDGAVAEWQQTLLTDWNGNTANGFQESRCNWMCYEWCDGRMGVAMNEYGHIATGCGANTRQALSDIVDQVCQSCMTDPKFAQDKGLLMHMQYVDLMSKAGVRAAIVDPKGVPGVKTNTSDRYVVGWEMNDVGPAEQCWQKQLSTWGHHINLKEHFGHIPTLPKLCTVEAACEASTRFSETLVTEHWLKKDSSETKTTTPPVTTTGCNSLFGKAKGVKKNAVQAAAGTSAPATAATGTSAATSTAAPATSRGRRTQATTLPAGTAATGTVAAETAAASTAAAGTSAETVIPGEGPATVIPIGGKQPADGVVTEPSVTIAPKEEAGMEEYHGFCEEMARMAFDLSVDFVKGAITQEALDKIYDNTCDEFHENPGTGHHECHGAEFECRKLYDNCMTPREEGGESDPLDKCGITPDWMPYLRPGCESYFELMHMVEPASREIFADALLEQFEIGRPQDANKGKGKEEHHHDKEHDPWACEHKCREFSDSMSAKFYNDCNQNQITRMDNTFVAYCENHCKDYIPPTCGEKVSQVWQDDKNWPCYKEWTGKRLEDWEKKVDGFCVAGGKLKYDFSKLNKVCRPSEFDKENDVLCGRFKSIVFDSCSEEQTSSEAMNLYLLRRQEVYGESIKDEHHVAWMKTHNFPNMCCHVGDVDSWSDYCEDPSIKTLYAQKCPNGCQMTESKMVTPLGDPAGYELEKSKRRKQFDREMSMGWRSQWDQFWVEPFYVVSDETTCRSCQEACWKCASGLGNELCELSCREKYCGQSEAYRWYMYDGMSCSNKRHILEQAAEIRMARSFLYTARDVVTGCTFHLRNWLVYNQTSTSYTTSECAEEEYICPDDEWWNCKPNPAFFRDPCCFHELRKHQCCAPRTLTQTRVVPTEVISSKVAGYVYAKNRATSTSRRALAAAEHKARMQRLAEHKAKFLSKKSLRGAVKKDQKKLARAEDAALRAERQLNGVSDAELRKLTNVALNSVNTFVVQEVAAAKSCFASFAAYLESVMKEDIMSTCQKAIFGDYYEFANTYFGATCQINSDCYTGECVDVPQQQGATANAGEAKRCKSPLDIEGKDFITPALKCLFRLGVVTNPEQIEIKRLFLRQNLGMVSGTGTDAEIRAKVIEKYGNSGSGWDAPLRNQCVGNHDAWHKKDNTTCLADQICNWSREAKGLGCTNPCHAGLSSTTGIASCPDYCSNPNDANKKTNEVSVFPTCYSAKAGRWEYEEQLNRAYWDCEHSRHQFKEKCSQECDQCRYGDDRRDKETACEQKIRTDNSMNEHEHIDWHLVEECIDAQCVHAPEGHSTTIACNECWSDGAWAAVLDCPSKVLAACQKIDADVDQVRREDHRWSCVLGKYSYSSTMKPQCQEGGCMSANGPQPAQASQCYGTLIQKVATHDSCWSLGSGHFESRYPPENPLARFHGGHHDTPPKYCWIKEYQAEVLAGGDYKPYVRPPRFGYSCPGYCERTIDDNRHCEWTVRESCNRDWTDIMAVVDVETGETFQTIHNRCRWETSCQNVEGCNKEQQKTRACADIILKKFKKQNNDQPANFEDADCFKCHNHEYISWDDWNTRVFSNPSLPDECRWNTAAVANTTQPCAESCHWEDCESVFRDCQFKGGSKQDCNTQVKNTLNQCRECQFIRCEDRCQNACNTFSEFHWWGHPSEACSGCDASTATCHPAATCYEDRSCWGEEAPYEAGCSRGCEEAMNKCDHESRSQCWERHTLPGTPDEAKDLHTSFEHLCHRGYDHFFRSAIDRLRWKYKDIQYSAVTADATIWANMDHFWSATYAQRMQLMYSMINEIYNIFVAATNKPTVADTTNNVPTSAEAATWCAAQGPLANAPDLCNRHPCCIWSGNEWDGSCGANTDATALGTCITDMAVGGTKNWQNSLVDTHIHHLEVKDFPLGKILTEFNQANGKCFKCGGEHNQWDTREAKLPWETKKNWELCLDSVTAQASSCSVCKLGCQRSCDDTYWTSLNCEHREIAGHGWQKLCQQTYSAAQTALVTNAGCTTCKRVRCDRDCKNPCKDVSSWNWHEHVQRCGGCTLNSPIPGSGENAQCAPTATCWMGSYTQWDGTTWPRDNWAGAQTKTDCFPGAHSRSLMSLVTDEDAHATKKLAKKHPEVLKMLREAYAKSLVAADKKKRKLLRKVSTTGAAEIARRQELRALVANFYNEDLSIGDAKLHAEIFAAYGKVRKLQAITNEELSFHEHLMKGLDKEIYELNRQKESVYENAMKSVRAGAAKQSLKNAAASRKLAMQNAVIDVKDAQTSNLKKTATSQMLLEAQQKKRLSKTNKSLIRHLKAKSEDVKRNLSSRFEYYQHHDASEIRDYLSSAELSSADVINKKLLELHLIKDAMLYPLKTVKGGDKISRNLLTAEESSALSKNSAELVRVSEELGMRSGVDLYNDVGVKGFFSAANNMVLTYATQHTTLRQKAFDNAQEIKRLQRRALDDNSIREQLSERVSSEFHVQRMRKLGVIAPLQEGDSGDDEFSGLSDAQAARIRSSPLARPDISPEDLDLEKILGYKKASVEKTDAHGRSLQAIGDIVSKNLECAAGGSCTTQQTMCQKFFERGTDPTAGRVTNAIASWAFQTAPWDSEDQACQEFDSKCFLSKDEAIQLLTDAADNFGKNYIEHDHYANCDQNHYDNHVTCSSCDSHDRTNCDDQCRCHQSNTTTIINARITHEGLRGLCWGLSKVFEKTRDTYGQQMWGLSGDNKVRRKWHRPGEGDHVWLHFEWDARLMGGAGGCVQHGGDWIYDTDLPADCYDPENHDWENYDHVKCNAHRLPSDRQCFRMYNQTSQTAETDSRLKFYVTNRRWQDGVLSTKATCEQESCYPDFFISDNTTCTELSYCRDGGCKKCKTNNWWDRETASTKKECIAIDANSQQVTDAAVCASLQGTLVTVTTQKKICKMTPPDSANGVTAADKCNTLKAAATAITTTTTASSRRLTEEEQVNRMLTSNTTAQYYYETLECGEFTPRECQAASTNTDLTVMDCRLEHWDKCETQEECMNSGECEYEFHEWSIRHIAEHEDLGLCVFPRPYVLDDFPIGWDHHHHHHMSSDTETTTVNPWKVNIHDWQDRHKVCQRNAPVGYVSRASEWGCVIMLADVNGGGAQSALETALQAADYVDGTMTHSINTTTHDYFVSKRAEENGHANWRYQIMANREITFGAKKGMNKAICTSIAGKWLDKAFTKGECIAAGHAFGLHASQTAFTNSDDLYNYVRNYTARTTVTGQTTPAAVTQSQQNQPQMDNQETAQTVVVARQKKTITGDLYSAGTFACCTQFHQWGNEIYCHGWSGDNKATCVSCGSMWMSLTKWRSWSRWISNRWTMVYSWQTRSERSRNHWITVPDEWRFGELFRNVLVEASFVPMKNFISCRGSPTLACLDALTNATDPDVVLGGMSLEDGGTQEMGDHKIALTPVGRRSLLSAPVSADAGRRSRSLQASGSVSIKIKNVKSVATMCYVPPTTATTASASNVFGAGCYTAVQFVSSGSPNRFIGQLVGDCLQMELPTGSSGANANICLTMSSEVLSTALNTEFQTYDFGQLVTPSGNDTTPYVLAMDLAGIQETSSQNGVKRLCGDISLTSTATYCPIKRYTTYRGTTADASHSCDNIAALQQAVQGDVAKIEASNATNFDMFGNPIVQSFDGNAFGAGEGVVADITAFESQVNTQLTGAVTVSGGQNQAQVQEQVVADGQLPSGLGGFSDSAKAKEAGVAGAAGEGGAGFGSAAQADAAGTVSDAPTEVVTVEASATMEASVSASCDTTGKMMSGNAECVAFRDAMGTGIYESIASVSTVRVKRSDVNLSSVGVTLAGRRLEVKVNDIAIKKVDSKKTTVDKATGRRLAAATLDVAYSIAVADQNVGNSMSNQLTTAKAAFEAKISQRIVAAIAADPTLSASGAFAVTGVTAKEITVTVTAITTTATPQSSNALKASILGLMAMLGFILI